MPSVPQLIAVYTCKLISQSMGNISNPFFSTAKPHEDSCLQNFQLTSPLQVVKVETNRKGRWWWQYILIESNLCKLYSFGAKNYFLVFPSKLMVSSAENVNVIPQNYVLF